MPRSNDLNDPKLKIIGLIRSSLMPTQDAPPQGKHSQQEATLEIFPLYCLAMAGLDEVEKLLVLYWMHEADREVLRVYPGGDRGREMIGVFRNRSPLRPNPIGISEVEILEIGVQHIRVRGLDAIDATPIIDLKSVRD